MPTKNYVDNKFNDSSIIKNIAHVDFNNKNPDNVEFVKINSMPAVGEHLAANYYVVRVFFCSVNDTSSLRLDLVEKLRLDEQNSKILNSTLTTPRTIIELPTKSYVDSLHERSINTRDL